MGQCLWGMVGEGPLSQQQRKGEPVGLTGVGGHRQESEPSPSSKRETLKVSSRPVKGLDL